MISAITVLGTIERVVKVSSSTTWIDLSKHLSALCFLAPTRVNGTSLSVMPGHKGVRGDQITAVSGREEVLLFSTGQNFHSIVIELQLLPGKCYVTLERVRWLVIGQCKLSLSIVK